MEQFVLAPVDQYIAVFLLAITGAMVAIEKKYDFSGVFVLALIAGASGGIIRDSIFLAQVPLFIKDWQYLVAILLATIVSLIFITYIKRLTTVFVAIDALGLGMFGIISAQIAVNNNLNILAAVFVGLVGAISGGFLRDILTMNEPLLLKPGQYYITAALAGIVLFIFLDMYIGVQGEIAAFAGIGITFLIRMLSFAFNWQTTPAINISQKLFNKKEENK